MFNATWADSDAFTPDETVLPVRLMCGEKLANNKKSNVARHVQNKHTQPLLKNIRMEMRGKKKLLRKVELSQNNFRKWMKSAKSTTYAGSVAAQQIVGHGKPFMDGGCIKEPFIKISEHLFKGFKKQE